MEYFKSSLKIFLVEILPALKTYFRKNEKFFLHNVTFQDTNIAFLPFFEVGNLIKATIILKILCLLSQLRNETWWLKHWTYIFKVTAHRIKCAKMLNYCFLPEWYYRAPVTRVLVISCPQNALSHTYCFKRKNVASGIRILYHEAQQVLKRLAEGRCF